MFLDEATIRVQGGRGGDGVISFISTRHNPRGGPDGGNGGDGGNVYLCASESLSTLFSFRNEPKIRAGDGMAGGRSNRSGARGEDRRAWVPVGTVVHDAMTGEIIADLSWPGAEELVARGGEGGRGNKAFTTSVRQAPRICERGTLGEGRRFRLELKLIADVGIIGYPNVGKSSLISRISAKKAKVGDYPFTTLVPNLGVVDVDGEHQFVAVDIPGLIEGAHEGKGLGVRFLRHIERTRLLIHLVDLATLEGRDPLEDYRRVNAELEAYSPVLARHSQVVGGNKVDLVDEAAVTTWQERFRAIGVDLVPLSAATGEGVRELVARTYHALLTAPRLGAREGPRRRIYRYHGEEGFRVDRDGDVFTVRGEAVEKLATKLVLDSRDAQAYLGEQLGRMGVLRELGRHGFEPGKTLRIGDVELELQE